MNRREVIFSLSSIVAALAVTPTLRAEEMKGVPHDTQMSHDHLPQPFWQKGYRVLTNETDRQNLTALFDRLNPADRFGPSASESGCIEFIDAGA